MTNTHDTEHVSTERAARDGGVNTDLLAQLEATLWLPHDMDSGTHSQRMAAARAINQTRPLHRGHVGVPDGGGSRGGHGVPRPVHGARGIARTNRPESRPPSIPRPPSPWLYPESSCQNATEYCRTHNARISGYQRRCE